jgi:hypothetical protein
VCVYLCEFANSFKTRPSLDSNGLVQCITSQYHVVVLHHAHDAAAQFGREAVLGGRVVDEHDVHG